MSAMMSADEAQIEAAVLCSFDQSGATTAEQRAAAHAFLAAARCAPGAWRAAAARYSASERAEVRFWCLQTLVAAAEAPGALGADRAALRPAVTAWLLARPPPPPFLRAKTAQLLAALLAADAAAWHAPLEPLLAACAAGEAAPLAAALRALHDDALCLDFDSSPAAAARACAVKDALKAQNGAPRLCGTIADALARRAADVAALVESFAPFCDWLDLDAAAGDAAPLPAALGAALGVAQGGDDEIRAAAAHVLARLLARRLPSAEAKLAFLRRLAPPPALAALAAAQDAAGCRDGDDDDDDAIEALIATAACEYLHAARHAEAGPSRAEAEACADALFPLVVCRAAARPAVGELPPATSAFVAEWITRCGGSGTAAEEERVAALVALLLRRARCAGSGAEAAEEAEEARAALLPTLRAAARVAPAAVSRAVAAAAAAALQPATAADVAPADVEAVLVAVHALGENVPPECEAASASLAAAIAASAMPHAAHPRVAPAFLELVVRYWKAFPAAALPGALAAFLDARGVMSPDAAAASRAAYLLTRFARAARPQLAPLAVAAAAALLPALRHLASRAADARLCAFEAAGLLLGAEEVPPADASRCAAAVLADITAAVNEAGAACRRPGLNADDAAAAAERLALALGALTSFSKGFPPSQTRSPAGRGARPALAAALASAFAAACAALGAAAVPRGAALLHRCCEALGDAALPLLPQALGHLLAHATSASAAELLQLLAALAQRYGPRVAPLLGPALPALFNAAQAAAAARGEPGCEAEAREAAATWHAFLLTLLRHAGGARLLLDPSAAPLLAAAAHDAATAAHVATRRAALAVLTALVRAADGTPQSAFDAPPGFEAAAFAAFAAQHVGVGACLLPLLRGDLDMQDAASAALLGEMAAAGSGVLARGGCGAAWSAAARAALAAAGVAPADAAEFEARFCAPTQQPPAVGDGKALRALATRLAAAAAPALAAAGVARVPAA